MTVGSYGGILEHVVVLGSLLEHGKRLGLLPVSFMGLVRLFTVADRN